MSTFQVNEWFATGETSATCNSSQHQIYFYDTLQKVMNYCASKGFMLKSDFAPEDDRYMEILEVKSTGVFKTVCFMKKNPRL
ncbi:MAG TPA: hypothetical protein DCG75_19175 [Bacteroidales bacterium]|nr:hypothetical protein [Bacteroidales bacterium]